MCFSAEASFIASAALTTCGVVAIRKAESTPQKVFATIPLLFGIQQFNEGLVWLSLSNSNYEMWANISTHSFLFFAWIIWPIYVPLSIRLMEKKKKRKIVFDVFLLMGLTVSCMLSYKLFFNGVQAQIDGYHIRYIMEYKFDYPNLVGVLYFVSIVLSPMVSSIKKMWVVGTLIFLTFLITTLFYQEYLISVWCFFAAITSFTVLWMVYQMKQKTSRAESQ